MTKTIDHITSRRSVIRSALPVALSISALGSASADNGGDLELRALWARYLEQAAVVEEAHKPYREAIDAFDAENPAPYDEMLSFASEEERHAYAVTYWDKRDAIPHSLWDAWNEAGNVLSGIIETIHATPAGTVFGIGVKLAAMPACCQEDSYIDALHVALADVDRLTGAAFEKHIDPIPNYSDGDEDEAAA